jgi:2-hydroxy-6-oxonona-2,4-dienedioate hydrolase
LDGRRARYLEAGAGPPLVIVHGLGLSSTIWARHFPAFTSIGLRVVAPDLPRFGGSEGPAFGQTVEEVAEWLLAFADQTGVAKAAWLGHSLAAQATIDLAARSPARARALILATPTGAPGRFRLLRQAMSFVRDIGRERPALIPAVVREYVKGSPMAFLGTWIKAARDDPAKKARSVHCPTLIVVGRADPMVPDSFLHLLAQRMPRARIARMRGGSHGVVFERWREFDLLAADFLRRAPH